jgi:D-alanyl-lipoteichoic acid acyltransferase DltB (MBOAT superfamily)
MLFNSYQFIFLFLPVTLVVFIILLRKADAMVAQIWLAAASVFFYAESGAAFLLLLGFSIAWNYSIGWALAHRAARKQATKPLLIIGIVLDLLLLAYF